MPDPLYIEWRTKNSQRRYPFADDVSLADANTGLVLANDVFVDAQLYPMGSSGRLYLSGISLSDAEIIVSDSNGIVAAAAIDYSDLSAFYFYDSYQRMIGIMVPGPGFTGLTADVSLRQAAGAFAQACVMPQNYACLNGILLEDGTLLTGDICWEGENGIQVTTEYVDAVPVIRIDAVGSAELPSCLALTPPVQCIKVNLAGGPPGDTNAGALVISQVGNLILVGTTFTLDEFCQSQPGYQNPVIPSDGCVPPVPPPDCIPGSAAYPCPTESYRQYYIWPMSDTVGITPVQTAPVFTEQTAIAAGLSSNPADLPARPRGGLKLFIKGAPDA